MHNSSSNNSNRIHPSMAATPPLPPLYLSPRSMQAPPRPPYVPAPCHGPSHTPIIFDSSFTHRYVPTLPPASSFATRPQPFLHDPDNELRQKIIKQIDYYFSDDNLAKDVYLRSKMDDKGWVSVDVIASFRRVSQLTNNSQFVLDCMRYSNTVEVYDGKLRPRGKWKEWLKR